MFRFRQRIHEFILFAAALAYICIEDDKRILILVIPALLALQFFFLNRIAGLTIGSGLMIGATWLLIAAISDYSANTAPDRQALEKLGGAVLLFLPGSVISMQMLSKYMHRNNTAGQGSDEHGSPGA